MERSGTTRADAGEEPRLADGAAASEVARLAAARRLLVSARVGGGMDRLAERARRLLSGASAQVSVLLEKPVVVATAGPAAGTMAELVELITAGQQLLVVEDAGEDDRVRSLDIVSSHAVGSFLGVALLGEGGLVVGALIAHDRRARRWSQADIALLRELAASTVAELALSALSADYDASRLRWELAIEAASIGTFDWDLVNNRVEWDERLQELFGYRPGEFVPHFDVAMERVHPVDLPALNAAISAAIEGGGDYRAEFRVVLPGGDIRWMSARGRAFGSVSGPADRLLGVCYDVTEIRTARDSAAHVLASMATGFVFLDRDWSVVYLNTEAERVLGRTGRQLVGRNVWEQFPGADKLEFGAQFRHAMQVGETVAFEAYYPQRDAWYEVRAAPDVDGLGVYFLDITERRRAQEEAERSARRLDLLGTVSGELAATLDAEEAVARLARLVVPELADWCLVTLVNDDGLDDVGSWHVDPQRRDLVAEYSNERLRALRETSYLNEALRRGKPVVIASGATQAVTKALRPGRASELLLELAPESGAVLPLRGRERTVGLLTLFRGASREPMQTADLTTAMSVAFRAGLALDNARLYHQQRDLAAGLQRTMLTEPPQLEDVEIAVRYQPAARAAAVGGDWYDSFVQGTGETVLVIGDVVGHDVEAAAAMGQLRGLLRGIAFHSGSGPAQVLTGLDSAMDGLRMNLTATAVVARLEHPVADADLGTTRLCWSNAGHPPPMVLRPDGSIELLACDEPDLLLGLDPWTHRHQCDATLPHGSTVLLYTDGLTERRAQSLDTGLSRLRQALQELGGLELDALCDEVLRRLLPDQAEDDVALVAVRLHHPGRPRPEAR